MVALSGLSVLEQIYSSCGGKESTTFKFPLRVERQVSYVYLRDGLMRVCDKIVLVSVRMQLIIIMRYVGR